MHEFLALEPFLAFQQRTNPIHYFRSQTQVFEGFSPFRRRTRPIVETSFGVHLIECFRIVGLQTYYLKDFNALRQVQNSHFGYFHTISVLYNVRLVSYHILQVKNSCFGWFHAISLPHLTHCENQYRVHQMHEFVPSKPFLVLSQRTCPIHDFSLKFRFWVVPCKNRYRGAFNA